MLKQLISMILISVALLFAGCGGEKKDAAGSDSSVGIKYLRQIVAENNKTTRTLMWQSEVRQNYSVEYRLSGTAKSSTGQNSSAKAVSSSAGAIQTQAATEVSFKEGKGDYIQYQARLEGLLLGATYEYRIVTEKNKSAWHSFKTDAGGSFTALIFPDSQSSDYSGWQSLVRDAQKRHQSAELYINMGDLVDNGQDASQWRAWLNSVEPFSSELAFAPVIGNHEAYSLE